MDVVKVSKTVARLRHISSHECARQSSLRPTASGRCAAAPRVLGTAPRRGAARRGETGCLRAPGRRVHVPRRPRRDQGGAGSTTTTRPDGRRGPSGTRRRRAAGCCGSPQCATVGPPPPPPSGSRDATQPRRSSGPGAVAATQSHGTACAWPPASSLAASATHDGAASASAPTGTTTPVERRDGASAGWATNPSRGMRPASTPPPRSPCRSHPSTAPASAARTGCMSAAP